MTEFTEDINLLISTIDPRTETYWERKYQYLCHNPQNHS